MPQFHFDPDSPPNNMAEELASRGFDLDEPVQEYRVKGWVVFVQARMGEVPDFATLRPNLYQVFKGASPGEEQYIGTRIFCFPKTLCGKGAA